MNPANNLTYLLHHLAQVVDKQTDQILKEQLGIGLSQYKILMVLEWNPRVQQNVISSSLGQTEASISRQIKLLIGKGMLISKIDSNNKRSHISVVTPFGMQVNETASNFIKQYFASDYSSIDPAQLDNLAKDLQELHKSICRKGKLGACNHLLGI